MTGTDPPLSAKRTHHVKTDAKPTPSQWTERVLGAVTGLVSAIVALGVAEFVAGLNRNWRSPVLDVGNTVVDNVPPFVKDFAIEQFGTNDKPALLIGIGIALAIYSIVIGVLAFTRRLAVGLVGIALFGLIGVFFSVTRRVGGSVDDALPTIVGASAGAGAMWLAHYVYTMRTSDVDDSEEADVDEAPVGTASRRQVLVRSAGVLGALALVGGGAGAVGRAIRSRFSATESRANVVLPAAADPLPPIPDAVSVAVEGMTPFQTPNDVFYRIDTALTVPQVPTDTYELAVTGMVDNEISLSFDDLLNREVVEYDITMTCVSNTVGGELVGNARWLGVRLDELLREAGVQDGANQVVGRSTDGYTCGFPLEAAMDGRNAMIAFGMNSEPLPLEHGFPVRLVVPGLYGYISATKWLTEIEITTFEDFEQYWVPRGYADRAPIKLMSRIDSVDGLGTLTVGEDGMVAIGGVAWAQTRGISAVEVQIDGGDWQEAELGEALNDDTWRQWAFRFEPSGTDRTRTEIRCRAIDGDGEVQTDERSDPLPDGATGNHQIIVFVDA